MSIDNTPLELSTFLYEIDININESVCLTSTGLISSLFTVAVWAHRLTPPHVLRNEKLNAVLKNEVVHSVSGSSSHHSSWSDSSRVLQSS